MLTLKARYFIDLGAEFNDMGAVYYVASLDGGVPISETEFSGVMSHFAKVYTLCTELKLPTATELVRTRMDRPTLPKTLEAFEMLRDAVFAELKDKWFAYIPADRMDYFALHVSTPKDIRDAFPYAFEELRNAGICYAFGLATACVFHAMRAVERGLHVAGQALGIQFPHPIELAEWGSILKEIEGKVEAMRKLPRSTKNDSDIKFYNEIAAEFRHFNSGWRIRVAHARETYEDGQAKAVLDHVMSFFEILSQRFAEF